ncbi:MAG: hypothetical protein WDW36_003813 [Sanguina aurantia]
MGNALIWFCPSQGLVLWALPQLPSWRVSEEWLRWALSELRSRAYGTALTRLPPREVLFTLLALSKLPDSLASASLAWADELAHGALQPRLARLSPQGLALAFYACARLASRGRRHARAGALHGAAVAALAAAPEGRRAGLVLQTEWLERFWAASHPLLPGMQPKQRGMISYALAVFACQPPDEWMTRLLECSAADFPASSDVDLGLLMQCLGRLKHQPSPAWMDAWLAEVLRRAPGLNARVAVGAVWGLAQLDWALDAEWLERFVVRCLPVVTRMHPQQLALVYNACASLHPALVGVWGDDFALLVASSRLAASQTELSGWWAQQQQQPQQQPQQPQQQPQQPQQQQVRDQSQGAPLSRAQESQQQVRQWVVPQVSESHGQRQGLTALEACVAELLRSLPPLLLSQAGRWAPQDSSNAMLALAAVHRHQSGM